MNKLLMCEHRNHTPPVAATRFFVLTNKELDPGSDRFWQHRIDYRVYRECEGCWDENSSNFHYSDLQVSRDDYLAALAMAEL